MDPIDATAAPLDEATFASAMMIACRKTALHELCIG